MNRKAASLGARRRLGEVTAVIMGTAVLALLMVACSGSPSPSGSGKSPGAGGSPTSPSAIAYSACMRSHGVPNYPEPDSGRLPKTDAQRLGVSSAQYQTAQQGCQHLLPAAGSQGQQEAQCMQNNDCSPTLVQEILTADRKLARCMRSHRVPNFPDPVNSGAGGSYFPISTAGISEAASRTPQFVAALNECSRLTGDNAPESFG